MVMFRGDNSNFRLCLKQENCGETCDPQLCCINFLLIQLLRPSYDSFTNGSTCCPDSVYALPLVLINVAGGFRNFTEHESCSVLSILQVSCITFSLVPHRFHAICETVGIVLKFSVFSIWGEVQMPWDDAWLVLCVLFTLPSYYRKYRWHKTPLPINPTSRF